MTEEQDENTRTAPGTDQADAEDAPNKRERSTIQFPYNDLDDAIKTAKAVHDNAGIDCTLAQLAGYVKQSITSGTFRVRLSAAATFGLTENERGNVHLTELGRNIADSAQEDGARIKAFLHVPLYARIYENYKGFTLPPAAALEKFMREIGVSSKQTNRARQAFMRSAMQAGFFAHGEDRLVFPVGGPGPGTKPIESKHETPERERKGNGGGSDEGPPLHPFIQGLLEELPAAGSVWPEDGRKLWLETASGIFRMIYKTEPAPESGQFLHHQEERNDGQ